MVEIAPALILVAAGSVIWWRASTAASPLGWAAGALCVIAGLALIALR